MNARKQKIADFIESVKDGCIESNTILLGGAKQDPDGINATRNGGDCSNNDTKGCEKSTNDGACQNAVRCCQSSQNGGACNNNALFPTPPGQNSTCGVA